MNICVIYGGKSGEHEVSLKSAASVVKNFDTSKYQIIAIGIDKLGRWHLQERILSTMVPGQGDALTIVPSPHQVALIPEDGIHGPSGRLNIDCVFPVLHGNFGEDGTVQGLLEMAGLPYVGAGVLGSAAAMDKETSKRLWRDSGLPIVDFEVISSTCTREERLAIGQRLGWPLFVKPVSAGSSLGASMAHDEQTLEAAIANALQYDARALIERYVESREIECAVIGNETPVAYVPGEIIPGKNHGFYDYEAKYTDPEGADLVAQANLNDTTRTLIMRTAEAAYAAVRCEGMARVDFFLEKKTGAIFLNEINTIPGFTNISMFPRMCSASGLAYPDLLSALVTLAVNRHDDRKKLRVSQKT